MGTVCKDWPELYDDLNGSSLASESDEQRQKRPPSERARELKGADERDRRGMESAGDMVAKYEINSAEYHNEEKYW